MLVVSLVATDPPRTLDDVSSLVQSYADDLQTTLTFDASNVSFTVVNTDIFLAEVPTYGLCSYYY